MMDRRTFIGAVAGGLLAAPRIACAQQPAMPVIGFLRRTSAAGSAPFVIAFRQGLNEAGFVDGQNVTIEYRWAKRLELLRESMPKVRTIGCFANPTSQSDEENRREVQMAARSLGQQLLVLAFGYYSVGTRYREATRPAGGSHEHQARSAPRHPRRRFSAARGVIMLGGK